MGRSSWISGALFVAAVLCLAGTANAADLAVLSNGFTIRHDHRVAIGDTTRLFFTADDSSFTDVATAQITGYEKDQSFVTLPPPKPGPQPYIAAHSSADLNQVVNSASAAYRLDPDLVNSVIHAESGFNSRAVSRKGARGLMQLMPSTASTLGVDDAFDPEANVGGGSRYLRELLERYNFDLVKALAAYNAGPARVEQYNGVPPFHETRAYVARIVRDYNRKKTAQEQAAARAHQEQKGQKEKRVAARVHGTASTPKRAVNSAPQLAASSAAADSVR
jgi:soluble lytic murein transglycosylase-like protein